MSSYFASIPSPNRVSIIVDEKKRKDLGINIYAATCRQGQALGNICQSAVLDRSFFNARDDSGGRNEISS